MAGTRRSSFFPQDSSLISENASMCKHRRKVSETFPRQLRVFPDPTLSKSILYNSDDTSIGRLVRIGTDHNCSLRSWNLSTQKQLKQSFILLWTFDLPFFTHFRWSSILQTVQNCQLRGRRQSESEMNSVMFPPDMPISDLLREERLPLQFQAFKRLLTPAECDAHQHGGISTAFFGNLCRFRVELLFLLVPSLIWTESPIKDKLLFRKIFPRS